MLGNDIMNITIVLPGIQNRPTGGSKIVFEYITRLISKHSGLFVTLCYWDQMNTGKISLVPLPRRIKLVLCRIATRWEPRWFALPKRVQKRFVTAIDDASIPDADWVFATAAVTAPGVHALSSSKGRKGYLIQGYETWDMPEERLRETYRYRMENVVIAHWLKDLVDSATGGDCTCIPNPVDTEVFHPDKRFVRDPLRVSVLYHPSEHKGFQYAWEAIEKAHEAVPDLHVSMFGTYAPPKGLPSWVEYMRNAGSEDLRRIYSTSAIFVCASVNEGYGLTCVEAMACGCSLVVTDFAGSREYAKQGESALVAPVGDVDAIAENIVRLLEDASLRESLGKAGMETARSLSWDKAIERFEEVLGLV